MSESTTELFTDVELDFLRNHRIAVVATGRRDGSPQVSQNGYHYDGTDIVVSVKDYTAKWHNVLRQPRVALLIHEGRSQLVIYGRAEAISEDPLRLELLLRIKRMHADDPNLPMTDDLKDQLNKERRTVLRITPESVLSNV